MLWSSLNFKLSLNLTLIHIKIVLLFPCLNYLYSILTGKNVFQYLCLDDFLNIILLIIILLSLSIKCTLHFCFHIEHFNIQYRTPDFIGIDILILQFFFLVLVRVILMIQLNQYALEYFFFLLQFLILSFRGYVFTTYIINIRNEIHFCLLSSPNHTIILYSPSVIIIVMNF